MSKKRTIFISLLYILLLTIINFCVILSASLIFNLSSGLEVGTNEYVNGLSNFLNKNQIWIVLISICFWVPYIYKLIKNTDISINKNYINNIYVYLLVALVFSLLWNIILFYLGLIQITDTSISISYLVATSILGPILEEFVFRGIIYNKLIKVYSIKKSIFLVSLFFGIYHFNVIQGIYAFLFSILLTIVYDKYSNILLPIIMHCLINIVAVILVPVILVSNYLNVILICLSVVTIGMVVYFCYNKKLLLRTK